MIDMPYFMTNEKWYKFDYKKRMYVLTAEAPKEAKESYDEYMKELNHGRKDNI